MPRGGTWAFFAGLLLAVLAGLATEGVSRWIAVLLAALLGTTLVLLLDRSLPAKRSEKPLGADFRSAIDLPSQAMWVSDSAGRMLAVGRRWEEWTGLSTDPDEQEGWVLLVHPDDQARVASAWEQAVNSGREYDVEYRLRFRDGQYRWVRARAEKQVSEPGAVSWIGGLEDIHERKVAEEQLRQTSTLLEMIGTSTDSIIYAKDTDGRMLYANRALERLAGMSLAEILGKTDREWHPNSAEADAFASVDRMVVASGSTIDTEEVFTGGGGTTHHFRSIKSPLRSRSGEVIGVVGVTTDISEQREAEERERLLMRELDHRAKNMLAVVQSVVTLTKASSVAEFKAAVEGRIQALGRAHSMLAESRWEGADLQRIVAEEIAPFEGTAGRLHIAGPPVFLKPTTAQSLALVLHELATNAAKHGALAAAGGLVDISWSLAPSCGGSRDLRLRWTERGGPVVPPRTQQGRRGFGTRLIRSSIERQLGGTLATDWAEEGLSVFFTVPLERSVPVPVPEPASQPQLPSAAPAAAAPPLRRRSRRQAA